MVRANNKMKEQEEEANVASEGIMSRTEQGPRVNRPHPREVSIGPKGKFHQRR